MALTSITSGRGEKAVMYMNRPNTGTITSIVSKIRNVAHYVLKPGYSRSRVVNK